MRVIIAIIFMSHFVFAQNSDEINFSHIFRVKQSRDYIPDIRNGNGVIFRDINGDMMPDLYIICLTGENRLLINNGAYRPYKDVSGLTNLQVNPRPQGVYNFEAGRTLFDYKYGACSADFDNDGDTDIVVAGWGIATSIYRNDGQLRFRNVTNQLDLFPPVRASGCISADINQDGLADLLLLDSGRYNRLFINRGEMVFADETESSGLGLNTNTRSAAFCDIDRDGDQDLYLANWQEADIIYQNDGSGYFRPVTFLGDVVVQPIKSSSIAFADIDNDGDFDFLVTTHEAPDYMYINHSVQQDSIWLFEQVLLDPSGITRDTNSGIIGDFDSNGWPDIFLTGRFPNELRLNLGNLLFVTKSDTESVQNCSASAMADFDLDGDLDIFTTSNDSIALFYQNIANRAADVSLQLIGVTSNRDAIGAVADFYFPGFGGSVDHFIGSRQITGGNGYASVSNLTLSFGVDTLPSVDAMLTFPNGTIVQADNLKPGETYTIYEYSLLPRSLIQAGQHMLYLMKRIEFWIQVLLALLFFIMTFIFIRLGLRRYRWSPATASAYLAGFFFLALIAIIALKKLGLLYNLLTINVLTIFFVATFILYSERLLRLRTIREKYRSVLLDLTNQIVNIHDNDDLIRLVTENILKNTEFEQVKIIEVNAQNNRLISETFDELNKTKTTDIINILSQEKYLTGKSSPVLEPLVGAFGAEHIFSIERNGKLFGTLILGASTTQEKLSSEDIDLFRSIANQMAIAIENNEYIQKSTDMIKKLTAAEVREKYLKELEVTNAALDSKNRDLQKLYDELRDTQAQLIHSEKMASLGQLVAGISHELNNPIGFIYANVRQLQLYTDQINSLLADPKISRTTRDKLSAVLEDIRNLISDTINGSQMIKDLVTNLRRFSHLDRSQWGLSNIHEGIESSIKIFLAQFKDRIQIHRQFDSSGLIECNAGQLNQVFLNILTNAAQAIPETGNIWIRTQDIKESVKITFRDDGSGMSADTQKKIFDPFYTTKEVGKGTGLGLSISYSIIRNHGGQIEVESQIGSGSTFSLVLPKQSLKTNTKRNISKTQVQP